MIKYIKTVAVYVSDQPAACVFYTEKLGLEIRRRESMGAQGEWLELAPKGGQTCLVIYPREMMPEWESRRPSIVFHCADVEQTFQELASRGVEFKEAPKKMPWGVFAQFADPDGNEFLLYSQA
jgi:predicted enzyme related to lactoylglutathione lyase